MRKTGSTLIALCLLAAVSAAQAASAPKVLATIKPVHALVSAVMDGVGTPDLLIGGAASVHSYALKPSDARKIADADLVFEVGPMLETYLQSPLANLTHGKAVALAGVPGVRPLPARHGGVWEDDGDDDHHHGPIDPHIWLDPENAVAMTRAIAAALCQADPAHAAQYRKNAAAETASLKRLEGEMSARLKPVQGRPFLVFHDAYQYFEHRFGLRAAGAVTVSPDRPPGPQRLAHLRHAIAAGGVVCLFREPQFSPRLVKMLQDGTHVRTGVLDPLGADIPPGAQLYPRLMRALTQSLTDCLKK